jgi:hypothetical protein
VPTKRDVGVKKGKNSVWAGRMRAGAPRSDSKHVSCVGNQTEAEMGLDG